MNGSVPPWRRKRLLVIDARVLTPNRDGGSLRMFNLLQIFKRLDFDISFVPSFPESFPPFSDSLTEDTARLRAIGVGVHTDTTPDEYLRRTGSQHDVVLMTGAFVASRHLASVRTFAPQALLIFDTIDLHFLREYRAARLSGNVPRVQGAMKLKRTELAIARVADFTLVVSEREKALLEQEDPRIQAWVVPNVHEIPRVVAQLEERRHLLFLGAYTFDPNVDAMVAFNREILPGIRRRLPGVRLYIAGADPTAEIRALENEDVVVTGSVEDLTGIFDDCRVFVAPLRFGAGIKGKLLLSMAHGLPAVASPIAVEGIPAREGEDVLVATEPADWVEKVVRLYQDERLWRLMSASGRRLIDRHYSFAAVEQTVTALVGAMQHTQTLNLS